MNYPAELLPQPTFKKITASLSGCVICRKVFDSNLLSQSPIVKEELLGLLKASDCFDYSTNLPGVFKPEHNKIELRGDSKAYFRAYWDEVSSVQIPEHLTDFDIDESIGWFFLPVGKIEAIKIPFNRKANTPPAEQATAAVVHTPTNSNFWHFSIKWKDENGYISTNDSKWKNTIIATVRALLSELIIFDTVEQHIERELYMNN